METLATVQREGRERLNPLLSNPSWLVLRRRRDIFRKWFARIQGSQLSVLDVGGRIQPYRPLLEGRLGCYVALDVRKGPLVNIVARAEQIPLAEERFDLVLCTQVLEYVAEPTALVKEIHRVLKPGGWLILSAPSVCLRDSDPEYWRFLPASLHRLLDQFEDVEVVPEGGSVIGLFRSINACLNIFVRYPVFRFVFRYTACPLINILGELLNLIAGSANDQFSANYSVLAQKAGGRPPC
jgi:SAM-dependent methyltransferase